METELLDVISYNKKRYRCKMSNVYNLVKNWENNRPNDNERVHCIYNYMKQNKVSILDGIIYIWKNGNDYVIYDGNHRFKAGFMLYDKERIDVSFYCEIYTTENGDDIMYDFHKLNKQIPVSDLYISNTSDVNKKQKIELIKQYYFMLKYKHFYSIANNPRNGNYNTNLVENYLNTLEINWKNIDISIIYNAIDNYNMYVFHRKLNSVKMLGKKFETNPLYIFYETQYEFKRFIENFILNT